MYIDFAATNVRRLFIKCLVKNKILSMFIKCISSLLSNFHIISYNCFINFNGTWWGLVCKFFFHFQVDDFRINNKEPINYKLGQRISNISLYFVLKNNILAACGLPHMRICILSVWNSVCWAIPIVLKLFHDKSCDTKYNNLFKKKKNYSCQSNIGLFFTEGCKHLYAECYWQAIVKGDFLRS